MIEKIDVRWSDYPAKMLAVKINEIIDVANELNMKVNARDIRIIDDEVVLLAHDGTVLDKIPLPESEPIQCPHCRKELE